MAGNDDENISFHLDLDAKEFAEQILAAKESVTTLGDSKNLEGLISGLTKAGVSVAALGVAAYALKATFETVFDAEQIKKTNAQFEMLSANAGIFGEDLKTGLLDSAKGLATQNDLLNAANKAILELGGSAAKIPELMDLARRYTQNFGGDLIENFNQLSLGIASGNQKMLKHMGIMVDVKKAYTDYAVANGLAADELSKTGQQQALLNAVLEKGKSSIKDIGGDVLGATTAWVQLKVTVQEVMELFTLAFDKVMGPSIKAWLGNVRDWSSSVKDLLTSKFGEGVEQNKAKTKILGDQIMMLKGQIIDLDQQVVKSGNNPVVKEGADKQIAQINEQIKAYEKELKGATAAVEEHEQKSSEARAKIQAQGPIGGDSPVDLQKQSQNRAKFEADMAKLRETRIKQEMSLAQSSEAYQALADQQLLLTTQATQAKIAEIKNSQSLNEVQKNKLIEQSNRELQEKLVEMELQTAEHRTQILNQRIAQVDDFDKFEDLVEQRREAMRAQYEAQKKQIEMNKDLTEQQKTAERLQAEENYQAQVLAIDSNYEKEREAVTNKWVAHANNGAEQFAKGFASASMKAQANLADFGAQGQKVFGMFTSHASNAFMQLGEGSKKGSEVMKEAMLGMVADVCQYYGEMMLAAGIFPPNPAALAGGAALLMLSGYLRGVAKKSSGGGGMVGGINSGGGIGDLGGVTTALPQNQLATDTQKQSQSVQLVVQGNLFETEQTRTRITEMVRQSLDSTDFSIQRVGGGV